MNSKKDIDYDGWELGFFDLSKNFRKYQFDLIKEFISGKVAEIGPGNGIFLEYYLDRCDKLDLFEPDKNLFSKLNYKFSNHEKIKVINEELNITTNIYDVILYLDVLEHIENYEKEILKAHNALKEGGHLVINVPAFQFLYSDFDKDVGHFKRYSKKDITDLVLKNNLKITRLNYYDTIGFLLSFLSKMISSNYKKNFEKKIKIWNSLIPASRILDKIFISSFGKSLLIVIKK
tara:strand:+ start:1298 stop:1996 length:699 start_codon:yes stop_codon:yes gene_type:complete